MGHGLAVTSFSRRASLSLAPSPFAQRLAQARGDHAELLDLTVSNPTLVGLSASPEALASLGAPQAARYAPDPRGLASAREALVRHDPALGSPEALQLTASTSEAYALLFKLLCDPGDAVLVPAPSYPLFEHLARFEGVRALPYPLVWLGPDDGWVLDPIALRDVASRAAGERVRAILVVSPNNPTGHYLRTGDAARLAAQLHALSLPVICDEVFAPYPLPGRPGSSPQAPPPPVRDLLAAAGHTGLVFSLDGLSKRAALPQVKLGWIHVSGPDALRREALARLGVLADAWLSVSTPVQHALPALLREGERLSAAVRDRTRANLEALRAAFPPGGAVTLLEPEGGWYGVLRLPLALDDDGWAAALLARDAVVTHPGYLYDFPPGAAHLVLSLLPEPSVFLRGVDRIAARAEAELARSGPVGGEAGARRPAP